MLAKCRVTVRYVQHIVFVCCRFLDLSPIQHLNEDDPVRPSKDEIVQAVKESKDTWFGNVEVTINREDFPELYLDSSKMLYRVPAMPDDSLVGPYRRPLRKAVDGGELLAYGYSTWEISGPKECGLGGCSKSTGRCPIVIGVRNITMVNADDEGLRSCGESGVRFSNGMTTAIVLGLAYIFSQRLIELQGQGDGASLSAGYMHYTDCAAAVHEGNEKETPVSYTDISIGNVEDDAKRWWQAVLAPGQGWEAVVATDIEGPFFAPWAIRTGNKLSFKIRQEGCLGGTPDISPPSSTRAIKFLRDFCRLHNAGTEFAVAVATALLLPVHNHYSLPANLDSELLHRLRDQNIRLSFDDRQIESFEDNLSIYLTLGCHPRGILSNLCGIFWEPNVPCNLVSAWLYPPLELLPCIPGIDGSKHRYHEVLVRECALRRPNITSLFLGACITGLISLVLGSVKTGLSILDLDAAAWTNSEQSFIQNPGSRPSRSHSRMPRSDIWRLLYITGEYPNPPLTPWKPFGDMDLQDIPVSVRAHHDCADHFLQYHHWSWELVDGSILEDGGRQKEAFGDESPPLSVHPNYMHLKTPSEMIPPSDTASEMATRHVFQWVVVNGDGYAPSERNIYTHEWITISDESSDDSTPSDELLSDDDSDARLSSIQTAQRWLMQ